ncbi:glycosyl transferase family 2 [Rhizobium sp. ACO-34A]|nr:glycosyl transferase family 2 [Rhizobium sp. ACO-34A]
MGWPGKALSDGLYEMIIDLPNGADQLIQPTLYVDSGKGYNEDEAILLNFQMEGERVTTQFTLKNGAKALRFDPSCQSGTVAIGDMYLRRMSTTSIFLGHLAREWNETRKTGEIRKGLKRLSSALKKRELPFDRPDNTPSVPSAGALAEGLPKVALNEGRYQITKGGSDYVYIPPRRPDDLEARLHNLTKKPIFSIIVPSYNTPEALMQKLLDSVMDQWYPHWELIIVDDASPDPQSKSLLNRLTDPRLKIEWSAKNQGIAGATNTGIELASGDYVVLLDHDDELTLDCLFELALCVNDNDPDYIYSDEDKIDLEGRFSMPHFKPDWSPDTMMSTMYVCHVSCIRRNLLIELGGLRSEYDGCQDWDLILRLTEKTQKICHIPKVLYHWRIIPGSVAGALTEKPYVLDASRRVREDALRRRGLSGTVEPLKELPGYFSVNYHVVGRPLVSIIIPTRDNAAVLKRCLSSLIENSTYQFKEIIIVDNGSIKEETIQYFELLRSENLAKIVRSDIPFNFSSLCNIGARDANGDILLFLNDDTEVITHDFLERMIGYAQLPHAGAIGAKLLYPETGHVQHAGVINLSSGPTHAFWGIAANLPGYFVRNLLEYNWLAVTGACLMVKKEKFELVGAFDETLPIAYNDVDLCFRLYDAGFFNVMCQRACLYHHESVSRGLDRADSEKLQRLMRDKASLYIKHPRYFQADPFYNINLDPNSLHFEYAK